ncbi:MAG: tetratricopeptide repeat protein [Geitlerinemataceae cyanobacterium]
MMPATKPGRLWKAEPDPDEVEKFARLNQEPLAELQTFIDFAEGFTLGLAEVEFQQDAEALWTLLRDAPGCDDAQLLGLWLGDPGLRFLRDALVEAVAGFDRDPAKRMVLVVGGLERSIKIQGGLQPLLKDLNFVRDAFSESVPHPLILILPRGSMERLARFTPDFWAWQSGLFIFVSPKDRVGQVRSELEELKGYTQNETKAERETRADLLQRLLARPTWNETTKGEFCRALAQTFGEYASLQAFVQEAAGESLANIAEPQRGMRVVCGRVVEWADTLGRLDALFLAFSEEYPNHAFAKRVLLDPTERRDLLEQMGVTHYYQGELRAARDCFAEALEISQRQSEKFHEAFSLGWLGPVQRDLGNWDEAERFIRQYLEVSTELEDRADMARGWGQLGDIERNRGNWDAAERLYRQSLEMREELGDRSGMAETLQTLGQMYQSLGRPREGFALIQQAMAIRQELNQPLGAYPLPNWVKRLASFAQRGTSQFILCAIGGLLAFPVILVVLIVVVAVRTIHGRLITLRR